jgi:hypothetical protein
MRSLVAKLDEFVSASDWLTDSDGVAIESLYMMAETIDADPVGNSKLFGVFGIAYRALLKRANKSDNEPDELEGLLEV